MDNRFTRYVIEARKEDGSLDFSEPQPEKFFGMAAITGISEDAIAKAVWRHCPDEESLNGQEFFFWAAKIDPRFSTRRKTW